MASPALAVAIATPAAAAAAPAQVNGLPGPGAAASRHESPTTSVNSSTKRKRDVSDDASPELNGADGANGAKPTINLPNPIRDEKELIHNYFDVLQRYDTNPPILKRPIPEPASAEEPDAKRQKSDDGAQPSSIQEKVAHNSYAVLDDLLLDIKHVIKNRVAELRSGGPDGSVKFDDEALAQLNNFKDKAEELHRREMSYPMTASEPPKNGSRSVDEALQASSTGSVVLTIWGNAPQSKHLFSSLQKRTPAPDRPEGAPQPLPDVPLPNGMTTTTVLPSAVVEKPARSLTLGELFPAPRNLPPLQPPKAPKSTTKSNVLGFYHPELAERSKYRAGSYFSQPISTGHWLDYSNATPSSQIKTRQRERAQSLAGHKPSSTELEMTEMEALFRGAFSSFAPSKDDTAAMIPSGQIGRMWWQRFGQRNFQRMIEAELSEDEVEEATTEVEAPVVIDEKQIQQVIDEWDDSLIDPSLSLEDVLAKKPDHEKDVDDTLQEISDLIETLSSYQRNRNLILPTSQNRSSADPAIADMLHGSLAQQPTDEEIDTYQMLKDQLSLIIKTLPPYAVARLNSDKLEELNVSTKLEVRSDEYKGIMEEDEPARVLRHQQPATQASNNSPRAPARAPSISGGAAYGTQQYGRQFPMQSQTPVPVPNHYPQTPVRPQMPGTYQRTMSGPVAGVHPQQQQQKQQRPPAGQPFRPANPNGYQYGQQMSAARSYVTPNAVPPYQGSQQRIASHPGFTNGPTPGAPGQRYPQGHAGYIPHQQPQGIQQAQHHAQRPGGYAPYLNGSGPVPQRTLSPQVSGQYQPAHSQSPQPQQSQQHPQHVARAPSYGTPGQPGGPSPGPARYAQSYSNTAPNTPQSAGPNGGGQTWQTSMSQMELQSLQARAQMTARLSGFGDKLQHHHQQQQQQHPQQNVSNVSGLAGIGLGGHQQQPLDMARIAAARAGMHGGVGQYSPGPRQVSGMPSPGMNGMSQQQRQPQYQQVPAAQSPSPFQGAPASPAPPTGMQSKPA